MGIDLKAKGYVLICIIINAIHYGFPQNRERAYYVAVKEGLAFCETSFRSYMEMLALDEPLPLDTFFLDDEHPYIM